MRIGDIWVEKARKNHPAPLGRVAVTDTWRSGEQGDYLKFERLDRRADRERMTVEAFVAAYELRTRHAQE